jgi:membrane protein required for colicin V production
MTALDAIVVAVMTIALVRGLWIGMVRELFSLGAIVAACIAVRLFADGGGEWLAERSGLAESIATAIAGVAIGVGALALLALMGRYAKRGVDKVGLRMFDRFGGAILGSAEGVIIAAVVLLVAIFAFGREDPLVARSRSVEAFDVLEEWALGPARDDALPDVAAPLPDDW